MISDTQFVSLYKEAISTFSFCARQKANHDTLINLGKIISDDLTSYINKNILNFLFTDYNDFSLQWKTFYDVYLINEYSGLYSHSLQWSSGLFYQDSRIQYAKKYFLVAGLKPVNQLDKFFIIFGNTPNTVKCCLEEKWTKEFPSLYGSIA